MTTRSPARYAITMLASIVMVLCAFIPFAPYPLQMPFQGLAPVTQQARSLAPTFRKLIPKLGKLFARDDFCSLVFVHIPIHSIIINKINGKGLRRGPPWHHFHTAAVKSASSIAIALSRFKAALVEGK